jgi:hypothetical protein
MLLPEAEANWRVEVVDELHGQHQGRGRSVHVGDNDGVPEVVGDDPLVALPGEAGFGDPVSVVTELSEVPAVGRNAET